MDDFQTLGPVAISLAIACAFGYAIWYSCFGPGRAERERRQKLDAQRGHRARAHGWRYEEVADGDIRYRMHGQTPGGTPWKIEYDSDHSSSSSAPKLYFRVERAQAEAAEWQLTDRKSFELMRGKVGRFVAGTLAGMLTNLSSAMAEHRRFLDLAREIPAGSPGFRQRFVLFGSDPAVAKLIDSEVERMILGWPDFKPSFTRRDNCFSASLRSRRLEVKIACDGPSFEVIEHLAKLGQRLTDRTYPR